jgi:hypothetical protein
VKAFWRCNGVVYGQTGEDGPVRRSTWPAEFIYDNLLIRATVEHASHVHGVKRLL